MAKLLEGIGREVERAPGTLIARALVNNASNDGALGVINVNDADAAVADGVTPGLNAHLV